MDRVHSGQGPHTYHACSSRLAGGVQRRRTHCEPTTGLEMEAAIAGGWTYDSMVMRDRETGCRYTVLRDQPARPLMMGDGTQSGCRTTTGHSVGTTEGRAPKTPETPADGEAS